MANVKMEELARVQTVGPGGIGVYPPVPTEKVDKVSSAGLGKEELQRSANVLPHPGAVDDGAVMQEIDGAWSGGQGGGGSADIDLGVTDASVGDYLKVKSVDEDGKPTAWESEPVDTETIVEATDAWLEENVAQETGYVLDNTLQMDNAAAPAKTVGDELTTIKTAVNDLRDGGYYGIDIGEFIPNSYIQNYSPGNIVTPGGAWKATDYIDISGTRNGTIKILMFDGSGNPTTDGKTYNAWYNAAKEYAGNLKITNGVLEVPAKAQYIRLSCRNAYSLYVFVYNYGVSSITEKYLKFATWNVGIFKDGTTKPTTEEAPEAIEELRKTVGEMNSDILQTNEYVDAVDQANTIDSTALLDFKYNYLVSKQSNKAFSKLAPSEYEQITFTSGSNRLAFKYYVEYQGKTICVILVHLSTESDSSVYRDADIAELITIMQNENYVILSGDFNVYSKAEYEPFTTAGFVLCNGGMFGWFDTWPVMENMYPGFTPSWPVSCIDNIIVSNNIVPQYVKTIKSGISDHAPLYAELLVK